MATQCQCLKVPVLKGKVKQIESWISGLANRESEVIDALKSEGIRDEAVFLSCEDDKDYLYLYSRADDLIAAGQAFEESNLPVDIEFKQLMSECLDFSRAIPLTLVFCADSSDENVLAGRLSD